MRQRGDDAMFELTRNYDGADLQSLKVSPWEFAAAERQLSDAAIDAIDLAIGNVRRFHEAEAPMDTDILVLPGIRCERRNQPIDAVGLYVPAGTAPLPSTAIMLAVPAAIANCPQRVLCTPADKEGNVAAATLVAAQRSGITEVFKAGGAQAIAAMAYGTETIPKVNRIFGPGNAWVTAAKRIVSGDPDGASIDMPAGPSEVFVIADTSACPAFVAADLLSQAEHGADSQVLLVTDCRKLAEQTLIEVASQLASLARNSIAADALRNSHVVIVDDIPSAIGISNRYAPEHLILQVEHARDVLERVRNAGSVFLGPWSPEAAGDYCSGTNHVLPTYGTARSFSGLGVGHFMRQMTVQELSADGLRSIAPAIIELATLEGLDAHARAVSQRLEYSADLEAG